MNKLKIVFSVFIPLSISLIILSATTCKKVDETPSPNCTEQPRSSVICTADYTPVCGCNQKTYSNACEAEARGIKTYTQGACPK